LKQLFKRIAVRLRSWHYRKYPWGVYNSGYKIKSFTDEARAIEYIKSKTARNIKNGMPDKIARTLYIKKKRGVWV